MTVIAGREQQDAEADEGSTGLGIRDDRKISDRQLDQLLRTMGSVGIKEQGITRRQGEEMVAMTVGDPAFQHVDGFDAIMLECGELVRRSEERRVGKGCRFGWERYGV